MAYSIVYGNKFLKDAKKMEKRGWDMKELKTAVTYLEKTGTLPEITSKKYRPHKLTGNYVHHWEAHIKPDWLIIWLLNEDEKTITLVRTGTHADLF
jgi:mRNA interferase YafQ